MTPTSCPHGQRYRESARAGGPARALALLTRELAPDAVPRGPGGHAVLPAEDAAHVTVLGAGEGAPGAPPSYAWRTGLAWVRLGLSERLRDACMTYLSGRQSEGKALLMQQMVMGTLAEVLMEHLEAAAVLEEELDGTDAALRHLHERITHADRALLRLLGAHGYTTEGPGPAAYASELLADVYCGARDAVGAAGAVGAHDTAEEKP